MFEGYHGLIGLRFVDLLSSRVATAGLFVEGVRGNFDAWRDVCLRKRVKEL